MDIVKLLSLVIWYCCYTVKFMNAINNPFYVHISGTSSTFSVLEKHFNLLNNLVWTLKVI